LFRVPNIPKQAGYSEPVLHTTARDDHNLIFKSHSYLLNSAVERPCKVYISSW